MSFGIGFTTLRQRRWIDGFDDLNMVGYRLLQPERYTTRIDQQLRISRQRLERCNGVLVASQRDAVCSEPRCKLFVHLAFGDKQFGVFRIEQQVRNKDRVVTDVPTTQVGEPSNVVQCGYPMMRRAQLFHLLAGGRELVGPTGWRSQSTCAELPAPPIFISSMPVPAS